MAIISRPLTASLRFVDNEGDTISSYHNIRPNISSAHVESFLQALNTVRGQTGGNAFLTVTKELVDSSTID